MVNQENVRMKCTIQKRDCFQMIFVSERIVLAVFCLILCKRCVFIFAQPYWCSLVALFFLGFVKET